MATKKPPAEKDTPHFDLARAKALVVQHGAICFTKAAVDGIHDMKLTMVEAMAVIASLSQAAHFKKSMPSTDFPGRWQDVYNVPTPKGEAYVKIQMSLRPGSTVPLVVIQFKAK